MTDEHLQILINTLNEMTESDSTDKVQRVAQFILNLIHVMLEEEHKRNGRTE